MDVDISQIYGNWDAGYSLDRHTVGSERLGEAAWGVPEFRTTRTEVGEALYRLKYRGDIQQAETIGRQLYDSFAGLFPTVQIILPMPPTRDRRMQPVYEIARTLARFMDIPYYDSLLVKSCGSVQVKNIERKRDKAAVLKDAFTCHDMPDEGPQNVLLVDDLYDTGSSLKAATAALRGCDTIENIFVAVVTRKK